MAGSVSRHDKANPGFLKANGGGGGEGEGVIARNVPPKKKMDWTEN